MTTSALPRQNTDHNGHAGYVPHDLTYSALFEDSLIDTILSHNPSPRPGLRILSEDSNEQAIPGQSIRLDQINWNDLPRIEEDELPLSLDDSRRIFASRIPGIKLTHPGGYLEGGPGLDPDMDSFAEDFFTTHTDGDGNAITTPAQLTAALEKEVEDAVGLLRQRVQARQDAREKNERIGRELKALVDQHEMELKIQSRMAEDQKRKKEARERRRRERDGGA